MSDDNSILMIAVPVFIDYADKSAMLLHQTALRPFYRSFTTNYFVWSITKELFSPTVTRQCRATVIFPFVSVRRWFVLPPRL